MRLRTPQETNADSSFIIKLKLQTQESDITSIFVTHRCDTAYNALPVC
jgi:hypothetical protein